MRWKLTRRFMESIVITVIITLLLFYLINIFLFYRGPENTDEFLEVKAPIITREFADKIQFRDNSVVIEEKEIAELKKYEAWLQVLDENGSEIYNRLKPGHIPEDYTPGEIVSHHKYAGSIEGYTIFIGLLESGGRNLSYIIGFPIDQVSKISFNYNPATFIKNILKVLMITLFIFIGISSLVGYIFSVKLANPIYKIMEGIKSLSQNNFNINFVADGIYKDVSLSLSNLSKTLQRNEIERKRTERMRQEWIGNITHDIRTPLASIKGYSELLNDNDYELSSEEIKKYSEIILRKTAYIENLIEDLKLTYQLKNEAFPLSKNNENLVDILREIIIAILNTPEYEDRDIIFESDSENIIFNCDSIAMQRAFSNIIYNAIVHNNEDIVILVRISRRENIIIEIKDNGRGIDSGELKELFNRYYRGTNTGEKHQGSGLGLVIAKQIIESHGGKIEVESRLGAGTNIRVIL